MIELYRGREGEGRVERRMTKCEEEKEKKREEKLCLNRIFILSTHR